MGHIWLFAHLRHRPLAAIAAVAILTLIGTLVGAALAWQRGLERAAQAGADPTVTYLVARGSEDAVERSLIEPTVRPAAQAALRGHQLSAELVHMAPARTPAGLQTRVTWRGVESTATTVRTQLQLAQGRWPAASHELAVGERVARELGVKIGDEVLLDAHHGEVVGIIDGRVGFAAGEIWLPLTTLQEVSGRPHLSALILREGQQAATFLTLSRPDLGLMDVSETSYLAAVARSLEPLRTVAWIVTALLLTAAAAGACAAAVARADGRRRQFATARCVGVSPWRLGRWLAAEALLSAALAVLATAGLMLAIDGTVLRLGTVAPVLQADGLVLMASAVAVISASLLTLLPTLGQLLCRPLVHQLRSD